MTDLLLSRGSTKYKEQVQKLLESQPAVKKDRAGELALGNSFLGLPGRGVVSPLGVQGRLKNRVRGEMARGGRLRPEKRGRPGNSKNATLPARESFVLHFFAFVLHFFRIFFAFFCILFLHFFCISQTRSHFFCIFFAFPRLVVIFLAFFLRFPNRQSFFAFFGISFTGFATFTACLILMRKRQENEQC